MDSRLRGNDEKKAGMTDWGENDGLGSAPSFEVGFSVLNFVQAANPRLLCDPGDGPCPKT